MAVHEYKTTRGTIVYDKRGLGDPVLMVHGIYPGASLHEYDLNAAALASHFTVYRVSLLGFGESDVPAISHTAEMHQHLLRDFIAEVIGEPAHVVASGVSGGIAARLGVYDDQFLRKLVLISPTAKSFYKEELGLGDKLTHFLLGTLKAGFTLYEVDASPEGLDLFLRENYVDRSHIPPGKMKQLFVEANESNKMMAHISLLCGYFDTDLAHWLPFVRRQTLVLMGGALAPAPDEWFKRAQWSMGKRLEVVPHSKSFPHEEQSAAVNKLLTDFLAQDVNPA